MIDKWSLLNLQDSSVWKLILISSLYMWLLAEQILYLPWLLYCTFLFIHYGEKFTTWTLYMDTKLDEYNSCWGNNYYTYLDCCMWLSSSIIIEKSLKLELYTWIQNSSSNLSEGKASPEIAAKNEILYFGFS